VPIAAVDRASGLLQVRTTALGEPPILIGERYGHVKDYLTNAARASGLVVQNMFESVLRPEFGLDVVEDIFTLAKQ
jgi:hypothetical protein